MYLPHPAAYSFTEIYRPARTRELVFVERGIAEINRCLVGLGPEVTFILLERNEPVPVQIARELRGRADVNTVHVITHGQAAAIRFSGSALADTDWEEYGNAWAEIGRSLGLRERWCSGVASRPGQPPARLLPASFRPGAVRRSPRRRF